MSSDVVSNDGVSSKDAEQTDSTRDRNVAAWKDDFIVPGSSQQRDGMILNHSVAARETIRLSGTHDGSRERFGDGTKEEKKRKHVCLRVG